MPDAEGPRPKRRLLLKVSQQVLAAFLRFAPREEHRLFLLTLIVGAVCGLVAVLFHLAIRLVESLLIERAMHAPDYWWIPWTIVTPTLGALLCGLLLHYVVPAARGSGIPQVKLVYAVKSGRLRLRDTLGKFLVSVVQIGSGSSLGREGPTVFICAGTASALGRLFALSTVNLRRLLPVGAAAGIAAAFNAPIAAVTFTIEEIVGDLDQTVLSGVVVAAAVAAVIERSVLGEHPVFSVPQGYGLEDASSLAIYAALGVAAALLARAFCALLLRMRALFARSRIPAWARPAIGGIVTGCLAVVALATLRSEGVTGGGYLALGEALNGRLTAHVMVTLLVLKLGATSTSYASGGSGGVFAPTLFLGGMLGGVFGLLDRILLGHADNDIGAFALVGMGAVFAGVVRAPITSVLIIFEMTGGYGLVLPLMIANTTAYFLARRSQPVPLYEALLEQDGHRLPHRSSAQSRIASLQVGDAMITDVVTLPPDMDLRSALERVRPTAFSAFPVVDARGRCLGVISEARLRRRIAEGSGDAPVAAEVRTGSAIELHQPLLDAVIEMNRRGIRQIAVVESAESQKLAGFLTMSDAMRASGERSSRTTLTGVSSPRGSSIDSKSDSTS